MKSTNVMALPYEIHSQVKLEAALHWSEVPWQAPFLILPYLSY